MARIVPAKPRGATPSEDAAVAALEAGLDDAFVVVQRGPSPGSVLVAHPDLGVCAVCCASGPRRWDPDAEAWDGADSAAAARAAERAHGTGPVAHLAFLPDTPTADRPGSPAVHGNAADLPSAVREALAASSPVGNAGMDALIQAASPGAGAYVRGEVTEAQKAWRNSARGGAAPAPAPFPANTIVFPAVSPAPPSAQAPVSAFAFGPSSAPAAVPVPEALPIGDALAMALAGRGQPPPDEGPDIGLDDPLILLLRQAGEAACSRRRIYVQGVEISTSELTEPDFLLPALLVAAAEDWAPVVVSKAGAGGFLMRLRSDPDSVLGYRLTALEPSAPLLLLLPVVDRIRRSARRSPEGEEEIVLDEVVTRFRRWLDANRLNSDIAGDVDMRLALKAS